MSNLSQIIKQNIQTNGPMPFFEFMQTCLYHRLGYYNHLQQIGASGDFTTAPEISELFAQCIFNQISDIFKKNSECDTVLEFGAGSGKLACCILNHPAADIIKEYHILDLSPSLTKVQQTYLQQHCKQFHKIKWLKKIETKFSGVVLANEVLDAMPVCKFSAQIKSAQKLNQHKNTTTKQSSNLEPNLELKEYFVDIKDNEFVWHKQTMRKELSKLLPTSLLDILLECAKLGEYTSEFNPHIEPWLAYIKQFLQQGLILLIDYGFPEHEYYHHDRNTGTLMCHKNHLSQSNPLIHAGEQDITAHVDFTAVAQAASKLQLQVAGFTSQANFLFNLGLLELMSSQMTMQEKLKLSQQVQILTMPHEMGELFKVMAITKNLNTELMGFKAGNQLYRL